MVSRSSFADTPSTEHEHGETSGADVCRDSGTYQLSAAAAATPAPKYHVPVDNSRDMSEKGDDAEERRERKAQHGGDDDGNESIDDETAEKGCEPRDENGDQTPRINNIKSTVIVGSSEAVAAGASATDTYISEGVDKDVVAYSSTKGGDNDNVINITESPEQKRDQGWGSAHDTVTERPEPTSREVAIVSSENTSSHEADSPGSQTGDNGYVSPINTGTADQGTSGE